MWIVESRPNRACLRIDRLLFVDTEKWCCYLIRRHRLCSPTMRKRFLQTCPIDWAAQDSARSHHHLRRSRSENHLSFQCCRYVMAGEYDGVLAGVLPTEMIGSAICVSACVTPPRDSEHGAKRLISIS